jgi:poly-gamma-glutamate synthesis protein (capsule biosynthesis protein)
MLDWGARGLAETLRTLNRAGVACAGAGENATIARSPALLDVDGKGRVLVFSFGSTTSGIPRKWGATDNQPGVNLLEDLSEDTARRIASQIWKLKQPGDVTVASIHWGSNWGYDIPAEQINFAHRLVEGGFSIVHGHSSHHVKAIEVYKDRLILYGCGDFLTDYEGIGGYEEFRGDLAIMYLADLDVQQNRLVELRLVPLRAKRFRLNRTSTDNTVWLRELWNRIGTPFGTGVQLDDDNRLILRWH